MTDPRMAYLTRLIRHGSIRSAESYRTGGRRKPAPIVHGTAWAYSGRECRCETCVTAYLEYRKDLRHQPRMWPAWKHGRTTTYKAGCRCEKCRAANKLTAKRYRAKKRVEKKRHAERLAYFRERHQAHRQEHLAYFKMRRQAIKAGTWRQV